MATGTKTKRLTKAEEKQLREELAQANNTVTAQASQIETLTTELNTAHGVVERLSRETEEHHEEIYDLKNQVNGLTSLLESERLQAAMDKGYARGTRDAMSNMIRPIIDTACRKLASNGGNGNTGAHDPHGFPVEAILSRLGTGRPESIAEILFGFGGPGEEG